MDSPITNQLSVSKSLKCSDIEEKVNSYKQDRIPESRYSSFDYCYNYFRTTEDPTHDMEKSCLMLGFYLSSWGMFRGSSFLLTRSARLFEATIHFIAKQDRAVWDIDVDNYNEQNIEKVIEIYAGVKNNLIKNGNTHLTLVTKVLLGVFGFIPAFDQYFCNTFRDIFKEDKCGFRTVSKKSLTCLSIFYEENKEVIDNLSSQTFTIDFVTATETSVNYPKAKIIDMYGFIKR